MQTDACWWASSLGVRRVHPPSQIWLHPRSERSPSNTWIEWSGKRYILELLLYDSTILGDELEVHVEEVPRLSHVWLSFGVSPASPPDSPPESPPSSGGAGNPGGSRASWSWGTGCPPLPGGPPPLLGCDRQAGEVGCDRQAGEVARLSALSSSPFPYFEPLCSRRWSLGSQSSTHWNHHSATALISGPIEVPRRKYQGKVLESERLEQALREPRQPQHGGSSSQPVLHTAG